MTQRGSVEKKQKTKNKKQTNKKNRGIRGES